MKTNFKIILIFSIFLLTLTLESKAQSNEYCREQYKSQFDSLTCENTITEVFRVNYMQCEVDVTVNRTRCSYIQQGCSNPINFEIVNISSVDWDYDNCPTLTGWLFPGYPDNWGTLNEYGLKQMLKAISSNISIQLFENELLQNPNNYQCDGTPPNCVNPNSCNSFKVVTTQPKCQKLCIGIKLGATPQRFYIGYLPCDDNNQSCCVTAIKMCLCGDIIKQTITAEPLNSICTGALPPDGNCSFPPGYVPILSFPNCVAICGDD